MADHLPKIYEFIILTHVTHYLHVTDYKMNTNELND